MILLRAKFKGIFFRKENKIIICICHQMGHALKDNILVRGSVQYLGGDVARTDTNAFHTGILFPDFDSAASHDRYRS